MFKDPQIETLIEKELVRQTEGIELIASENYASEAVMKASGSILTNKYAEGLPKKRYYGGCEFVDEVEQVAIDRLKELFGASWANVQPHSGSQANAAVFLACLNPGDSILGFDLSHGGHLTHGSPVNFSGKFYDAHFYGVEKATGTIDYNKVKDQVQTAIVVPITPEFVKCKSCGTNKVIYDLVEIEQSFWDEYSDFVDKMYDVLGDGVLIKERGKND